MSEHLEGNARAAFEQAARLTQTDAVTNHRTDPETTSDEFAQANTLRDNVPAGVVAPETYLGQHLCLDERQILSGLIRKARPRSAVR